MQTLPLQADSISNNFEEQRYGHQVSSEDQGYRTNQPDSIFAQSANFLDMPEQASSQMQQLHTAPTYLSWVPRQDIRNKIYFLLFNLSSEVLVGLFKVIWPKICSAMQSTSCC